MTSTASTLPLAEVIRRIERDHQMLAEEVGRHPETALTAPLQVAGGPLGDSCESLRDLVAHVLMWDEIDLAVLTEASRGRRHWSLDPRWETRQAGQALNRGGVAAARELPVPLLLHRFAAARDALIAELRSYDQDRWHAPVGFDLAAAHTTGSLAQYVMTVPGAEPCWHAAIHLGRLAEAAG